MRIGLDMDGCICDNRFELCYRLSKVGIESKPNEWKSFYVEEVHQELPDRWASEQFRDPTLYLNSRCDESAYYMINKWFYAGNDIFIITARNEEFRDVTERWLDEWGIPYNELHMEVKRLTKSARLQELECHVMLEDDLEEANLVNENGVKSFLRTQSYNKNMATDKGVIRINDFYGMHNILQHEHSFNKGRH